jgi:hypothetical protein
MYKNVGFLFPHLFTFDDGISTLEFIYVNNKLHSDPTNSHTFFATGHHWPPSGATGHYWPPLAATSHKMDSDRQSLLMTRKRGHCIIVIVIQSHNLF